MTTQKTFENIVEALLVVMAFYDTFSKIKTTLRFTEKPPTHSHNQSVL